MAKVLRWKEKLILAFVSLFLSVTAAWPLGTRDAGSASYSRLVTANGETTVGVELMTRKPYVRLVRASRAPVALPLTTGAYVAMAGAMGTAAAPTPESVAADAASSCGGGGTSTNSNVCFTEICSEYGDATYPCRTCGYGTCNCHTK